MMFLNLYLPLVIDWLIAVVSIQNIFYLPRLNKKIHIIQHFQSEHVH